MNAAQLEHPTGNLLIAYGLGQLGEQDLAGLDGHLANCELCRQVVEGVAPDTLLNLLRSAATEPDSTEWVAESESRASGLAGSGSISSLAAVPSALTNHPRYRVGELLGVGGMGAVYKAEHLLMQRPVALKVLNRELMDKPATVERFRREVRAAARLTHPNIVHAFDAEQAGDVHFLVMEFVEGVSLARCIAENGPLPVAQACDVVRQAALGLQHAHECGMVHRDIKPQNLMLTPSGQVKILDDRDHRSDDGQRCGEMVPDAGQSGRRTRAVSERTPQAAARKKWLAAWLQESFSLPPCSPAWSSMCKRTMERLLSRQTITKSR